MITVDTILSYTTCGETHTTTFGTWCHNHPSGELHDLADSLGRVGVAHWRAPDGSEYELRVERETFEQRCEYLRARAQDPTVVPMVTKLVREYAKENVGSSRGLYAFMLTSGRWDDDTLRGVTAVAQAQGDFHGCALGRLLLAMPLSGRKAARS